MTIEKVYPVIASETKQSHYLEADYSSKSGDCFVASLLAMTNYAALLFSAVLVRNSSPKEKGDNPAGH